VISQTIDRILERIPRTERGSRAQDREDMLLHKIMFRTSKAFGSPFVLLSVDLRDHRRVAGYLAINEPHGGAQIWPVLQHTSSIREPMIVPDLTRYSLLGTGPQTPALHVQAFANVPLITSSGRTVGVLSLLDFHPQTLTAPQFDLLVGAGRRIADELTSFYNTELADTRHSEVVQPRQSASGTEGATLTDRLTALASRHAGEQTLDRELARARRINGPFSLALIDLDHFNQVNDRHGHDTGDAVLKHVSKILKSTFRASDFGVRWWGDEFLILLPDVPLNGALAFAERARAQVAALAVPGVDGLSLSAGVEKLQPDEFGRAAGRRADARLYEAKRTGRNRVIG
jgi:diguanylate cyclase (GGDEF)-like protein